MQISRYLFAGVAVLFVIGVVVQFYLAGIGLLGGGGMEGHVGFGYLLALIPVLPLVLSWPSGAGARTAGLCAALLVMAQVQTFLPLAADGAPLIAALHPVNALVVFGMGLMVARRAISLVRGMEATQAPDAAAVLTNQA
jgi:hypothetical protein